MFYFFLLLVSFDNQTLLVVGFKEEVKEEASEFMEEGGAILNAVGVEIVDAADEDLPSDRLVGGWLDDKLAEMSLGENITVFVVEFVEIIFVFHKLAPVCAESACCSHMF